MVHRTEGSGPPFCVLQLLQNERGGGETRRGQQLFHLVWQGVNNPLADLERMAGRLFPGRVQGGEIERIRRRYFGGPLFLEELKRIAESAQQANRLNANQVADQLYDCLVASVTSLSAEEKGALGAAVAALLPLFPFCPALDAVLVKWAVDIEEGLSLGLSAARECAFADIELELRWMAVRRLDTVLLQTHSPALHTLLGHWEPALGISPEQYVFFFLQETSQLKEVSCLERRLWQRFLSAGAFRVLSAPVVEQLRGKQWKKVVIEHFQQFPFLFQHIPLQVRFGLFRSLFLEHGTPNYEWLLRCDPKAFQGIIKEVLSLLLEQPDCSRVIEFFPLYFSLLPLQEKIEILVEMMKKGAAFKKVYREHLKNLLAGEFQGIAHILWQTPLPAIFYQELDRLGFSWHHLMMTLVDALEGRIVTFQKVPPALFTHYFCGRHKNLEQLRRVFTLFSHLHQKGILQCLVLECTPQRSEEGVYRALDLACEASVLEDLPFLPLSAAAQELLKRTPEAQRPSLTVGISCLPSSLLTGDVPALPDFIHSFSLFSQEPFYLLTLVLNGLSIASLRDTTVYMLRSEEVKSQLRIALEEASSEGCQGWGAEVWEQLCKAWGSPSNIPLRALFLSASESRLHEGLRIAAPLMCRYFVRYLPVSHLTRLFAHPQCVEKLKQAVIEEWFNGNSWKWHGQEHFLRRWVRAHCEGFIALLNVGSRPEEEVVELLFELYRSLFSLPLDSRDGEEEWPPELLRFLPTTVLMTLFLRTDELPYFAFGAERLFEELVQRDLSLFSQEVLLLKAFRTVHLSYVFSRIPAIAEGMRANCAAYVQQQSDCVTSQKRGIAEALDRTPYGRAIAQVPLFAASCDQRLLLYNILVFLPPSFFTSIFFQHLVIHWEGRSTQEFEGWVEEFQEWDRLQADHCDQPGKNCLMNVITRVSLHVTPPLSLKLQQFALEALPAMFRRKSPLIESFQSLIEPQVATSFWESTCPEGDLDGCMRIAATLPFYLLARFGAAWIERKMRSTSIQEIVPALSRQSVEKIEAIQLFNNMSTLFLEDQEMHEVVTHFFKPHLDPLAPLLWEAFLRRMTFGCIAPIEGFLQKKSIQFWEDCTSSCVTFERSPTIQKAYLNAFAQLSRNPALRFPHYFLANIATGVLIESVQDRNWWEALAWPWRHALVLHGVEREILAIFPMNDLLATMHFNLACSPKDKRQLAQEIDSRYPQERPEPMLIDCVADQLVELAPRLIEWAKDEKDEEPLAALKCKRFTFSLGSAQWHHTPKQFDFMQVSSPDHYDETIAHSHQEDFSFLLPTLEKEDQDKIIVIQEYLAHPKIPASYRYGLIFLSRALALHPSSPLHGETVKKICALRFGRVGAGQWELELASDQFCHPLAAIYAPLSPLYGMLLPYFQKIDWSGKGRLEDEGEQISSARILDGLQSLLFHLEGHIPIFGMAAEKDRESLDHHQFFRGLYHGIHHFIRHYEAQIREGNREAEEQLVEGVYTLAIAGRHCGTRWLQEIGLLMHSIAAEEMGGGYQLRDWVFDLLAYQRLNSFEMALHREGVFEAHARARFFKACSELGLPQEHQFSEDPPLSESVVNLIRKRFFERFTLIGSLKQLQETAERNPLFWQLLVDWAKENLFKEQVEKEQDRVRPVLASIRWQEIVHQREGAFEIGCRRFLIPLHLHTEELASLMIAWEDENSPTLEEKLLLDRLRMHCSAEAVVTFFCRPNSQTIQRLQQQLQAHLLGVLDLHEATCMELTTWLHSYPLPKEKQERLLGVLQRGQVDQVEEEWLNTEGVKEIPWDKVHSLGRSVDEWVAMVVLGMTKRSLVIQWPQEMLCSLWTKIAAWKLQKEWVEKEEGVEKKALLAILRQVSLQELRVHLEETTGLSSEQKEWVKARKEILCTLPGQQLESIDEAALNEWWPQFRAWRGCSSLFGPRMRQERMQLRYVTGVLTREAQEAWRCWQCDPNAAEWRQFLREQTVVEKVTEMVQQLADREKISLGVTGVQVRQALATPSPEESLAALFDEGMTRFCENMVMESLSTFLVAPQDPHSQTPPRRTIPLIWLLRLLESYGLLQKGDFSA